jgi:hypothetical protein
MLNNAAGKICAFLSLILLLAGCQTQNPSPVQDLSDDTLYLQSLLDSPGSEIMIPAKDTPWISGPLFLSSTNKRITFGKGCTVLAKIGAFLDPGDCLLTISDSRNITVSGYSATLKMRKDHYASKPYKSGEWRHGISIRNSSHITIEGLTIRESGGDGVYIGQNTGQPVCEDIVLRDLDLGNNYRQGVSVVSVRGFLMEHCSVTGTRGTPPSAGIDFEPNSDLFGFTACVIRNCIFEKNGGPGILVYLKKMTSSRTPFDLVVENTRSVGNLSATAIYGIPRGVTGSVVFRNCTLKGLRWIWPRAGFTVRFVQP